MPTSLLVRGRLNQEFGNLVFLLRHIGFNSFKLSFYKKRLTARCFFIPILFAVVRKGEVVDQGTHHELVKRGGFYAALVAKQNLVADDAEQNEVNARLSHTSFRHMNFASPHNTKLKNY